METETEYAQSTLHESRARQPCPTEPINRLFVWSGIEGYEKQPTIAPGRASASVCV